MLFRAALAFLLSCCAARPGAAELREQFQLWTSIAGSVALSERATLKAEGEWRYGESFRDYQRLLGGAVAYRLSSRVGLEAGYTHVLDTAEDEATRFEHRPHQQIGLALGELAGGEVGLRTRLETRIVEDSDDPGFRLRQLVSYARPLAENVAIVASVEPFIALNDTDYGARSGLDSVRTFGGLALGLGASAVAEIGYLNQWASRRRRSDEMDHILFLGLLFDY